MEKCTDKNIGSMIHAYELGILSKSDLELFELHLLDCTYCFNEIKTFQKTARIIQSDSDIRKWIAKAVRSNSWNQFKSKVTFFAQQLLVPESAATGFRDVHAATEENLVVLEINLTDPENLRSVQYRLKTSGPPEKTQFYFAVEHPEPLSKNKEFFFLTLPQEKIRSVFPWFKPDDDLLLSRLESAIQDLFNLGLLEQKLNDLLEIAFAFHGQVITLPDKTEIRYTLSSGIAQLLRSGKYLGVFIIAPSFPDTAATPVK